MLADSGWTGAPLDRIVSEELMSFAAQVNVTGCDIPLNTPAAQNLSLILHELTTNAVKYGALSRPEGRVIIEGKIETEINGSKRFRLTWKELDGPAVTQSGRKGFGSTILYGLAKQVAQNVEAKFRPEGLFYELQIPLKSIEGSKTDFQRLLNWPSVQPQRNGRSELSAGTSRCHPNPA
jgi:two-component sensor histidine kinase